MVDVGEVVADDDMFVLLMMVVVIVDVSETEVIMLGLTSFW